MGALQRSEITQPDTGETLYNQDASFNPAVTPGTAGAAFYGGGNIRYEMTRSDAGVTVTVRIRFVDQPRDTNRTLPSGATNPNYLGHTGSPGVISAGDPRRAFARTMCQQQTTQWNGRLRFKGRRSAAWYEIGSSGHDVILPVTFRSVPVFDATSPAHSTVRLYGPSVTPGQAQGHPIDAGNYYMNTGSYGASAQAIYAHEYGHLIGLQDEYAQSNFQMHALLHRISPRLGGARGAALDRATVERMVLAALTRPLALRLGSAGTELSRTFIAGKGPLRQALVDGLRGGAADPAVAAAATARLTAALAPSIHGRIPQIVGFQTGRNFSNLTLASEAINREFDPAALGGLLVGQYATALQASQGTKVNVGGGPSGQIGINIAGGPGGAGSGIWAAANSGPLATSAGGVATSSVGAAGTTGRIPPVRPSASLIAQVAGIPAAWATAPASLAASITPSAIAAAMASAISAAAAAAAAPAPAAAPAAAGAGPAPAPPPVAGVGRAYRLTFDMIQAAARSAARSQIRSFLASQLAPLLAANVTALESSIRADVNRVMAMPAGAVAASSPPDASLRAVVSAMQARLAAQTPAGQDPTSATASAANPASPTNNPTGGAVASQDVTYDNTGMMSDNSGDIRPDQFQQMVGQFNNAANGLIREGESPFTAEVTR